MAPHLDLDCSDEMTAPRFGFRWEQKHTMYYCVDVWIVWMGECVDVSVGDVDGCLFGCDNGSADGT